MTDLAFQQSLIANNNQASFIRVERTPEAVAVNNIPKPPSLPLYAGGEGAVTIGRINFRFINIIPRRERLFWLSFGYKRRSTYLQYIKIASGIPEQTSS